MKKTTEKIIPQHIVIIPDGNRRWAKAHGVEPVEGHKKGLDTALKLVQESKNIGVKVLTLWGFSTENWNRSTPEVKYLMNIYTLFFKKHFRELIKEGVKLHWVGRRDRVPKMLKAILEKIEKETKKNTKYVLNICIDYGGRDELVRAFKKMIADKVTPSEDNVSAYLDTAGQPDPDLLIRTSGEERTSGLFPWQTAYTELYFSKLYFPDFSSTELRRAISEFGRRQRRFGQ